MKHVKKVILAVALLAVCVFLLAACSLKTMKGWVFDIETGDKISISIESSKGYDITSDVPFSVQKNGKEIMSGKFAFCEAFDIYKDVIAKEDNVPLLDQGAKDGFEYLLYSVVVEDDTGYRYFLRINNTTISLLTTNLTEEEARAVFDAMEFDLESAGKKKKPAASSAEKPGPDQSESPTKEPVTGGQPVTGSQPATGEQPVIGGKPVPENKPAVKTEIDLLTGSGDAYEMFGGELMTSDFTVQESSLSQMFGTLEDAEDLEAAIENLGYTAWREDGQLLAYDGDYGFALAPDSSGQGKEVCFTYWGLDKFDTEKLSADLAYFTGVQISPEQIENCLDYVRERQGDDGSYYIMIHNDDISIQFHVEMSAVSYFVFLTRIV